MEMLPAALTSLFDLPSNAGEDAYYRRQEARRATSRRMVAPLVSVLCLYLAVIVLVHG